MGGDEQWNLLRSKGLLSESEIVFLKRFPGHRELLLQHWAVAMVHHAMEHPDVVSKYTPPERAAIRSRSVGQIVHIIRMYYEVLKTLSLPVPFQYFHLMNILLYLVILSTLMYCCLETYKSSEVTYCAAVIPFVIMTFLLLSLRRLSSELACPFGHDAVDFPLADFMRHAYDHPVALVVASTY